MIQTCMTCDRPIDGDAPQAGITQHAPTCPKYKYALKRGLLTPAGTVEDVIQFDVATADLEDPVPTDPIRPEPDAPESPNPKLPDHPVRRRMAAERAGTTHHFSIAGHKGYITINTHEDGAVGEVFLRMAKQGSTVAGFCDAWSITFSIALQYGVPLEKLIDKFRGMRFEPSGRTITPGLRSTTSVIDYTVRYIERRFVLGLPLMDEEPA